MLSCGGGITQLSRILLSLSKINRLRYMDRCINSIPCQNSLQALAASAISFAESPCPLKDTSISFSSTETRLQRNTISYSEISQSCASNSKYALLVGKSCCCTPSKRRIQLKLSGIKSSSQILTSLYAPSLISSSIFLCSAYWKGANPFHSGIGSSPKPSIITNNERITSNFLYCFDQSSISITCFYCNSIIS